MHDFLVALSEEIDNVYVTFVKFIYYHIFTYLACLLYLQKEKKSKNTPACYKNPIEISMLLKQ